MIGMFVRIFVFVCLFVGAGFNATDAQAIQTDAQGTYIYSPEITENKARKAALVEAKRDAVEKIAALMVSSSAVENAQLSEDKAKLFAAARMRLTGSPRYIFNYAEHICTAFITATVEIDEETLKKLAE